MSELPKLVLASASPRRAEILRNAGFDFEVSFASVDETRLPGETARAYVQRVAKLKVQTAMSRLRANGQKDFSAVVAADTVVVIAGQVLGKPRSEGDARQMLRRLSGKWHDVFTGLAVLSNQSRRMVVVAEKTRVKFARLSASEIDEYIRTEESLDKAGAYAIQGRGGKFILRVDGCYFNVMGLPLARLYAILHGLKLQ